MLKYDKDQSMAICNPKTRYFTLIELLVVVAIIAVLVAVLLPAFQSARNTANKVICMSRLSQINLGMNFYKQDYNKGPLGFTFGGWPAANPYLSNEAWFSYQAWGIGPYLKRSSVYTENWPTGLMDSSNEVFYCPTFIAKGIRPSMGAGYAVNLYLAYNTFLGDRVFEPGSTPMLWCDAVGPDGGGIVGYPWDIFQWNPLFPIWFMERNIQAHRKSANYLFFDGHIINQPLLNSSDDYLQQWTWSGG
jgi:prepilin-type N-terminal cleavage/methylation domain-containing protein/prepilin-type processing-associated H-X9-DG protein